MKKNLTFVFLLLGFIALVGSLPIKADEVNVNGPYIDTPTLTDEQIYNLSNTNLLLEFLRQGGTIDVGNTSPNYSNNDLFDDFGDFVRDVLNGRDTGIDLIDFINPFQSEVEYNGLHAVGAPKSAITNFMGWLPFYALSQDNDNDNDNPDPNYSAYIEKINGINDNGFFWKNYTYSNVTSPYPAVYPVPNTLSFYNNKSWFNTSYPIGDKINGTGSMMVSEIITISITTSENSVLCTLSGYNPDIEQSRTPNQAYYIPYESIGDVFRNIPSSINSMTFNNSYRIITTSYQFNTLQSCFECISSHFRNVNIIVDGVPWSIVSQLPSYQIDISTGTTVATNDYDYVHWVYDYEIYFRIDRIWDLVEEILNEIRNPSDPSNPRPTVITWTDFEDVIYDVDGNKAVGVKILTPDTNIDEEYISNYGPLVPVFVPLFTPVINDSDIVNIIEAPMDAIPSDLLDVFGYIFIGTLFVCFIHRLLE